MISSLRSTLNLATTPLRRHRWVLVGCLLLFVGYGEFSLRNDDPAGMFGRFYHHGWPWLFMSRHISQDQLSSEWLDRVSFTAGVYEFQWSSLLANFTVALGLSLGITCLWWLHCRQGKPWQVNLREIMLLMLVFSVGAGGYLRVRASYEEEVAQLDLLYEQGWTVIGLPYMPWYLQPARDLSLIDTEDWLSSSIAWTGERGNHDLHLDLRRLAKGRPLSALVHTVTIRDPECDDEVLELLAHWMPYCEGVHLYEGPRISGDGLRRLGAGMPRMKRLSIELRQADDEILAAIGQMKYLEDLTIDQFGEATTLPTNLAPLRQLKYLKSLQLPENWELSREDEEYFERNGVRVNEMWRCAYSFAP